MPNIKHQFSSGIADSGDGTLVQPSNWNAEHSLDTYLDFAAQTSAPSAPDAAGSVRVFGVEYAGHPFLSISGYGESDGYLVQPSIWAANYGQWSASNGASISVWGGMPATTVGTISTPAASIGNLQSITRRFVVTSSSLAASQASVRSAMAMCHKGGAAVSTGSPGGFFFAANVGTPVIVASSTSAFVGLANSTGAATIPTQPHTLSSVLGFGFGSGASVWSFYSASGASPAASTPLTGFDVSASAWHRFMIHNPPEAGGSVVYWWARNAHSGAVSSGSVTSPVPNSASLLGIQTWIHSTGAGSKALAFSVVALETEY